MPEFTPLETLPAFNAAIRARLAEYWIGSAEEFVSTARAANVGLGSGLAALTQVLGLPETAVRELVQAGLAVLPDDVAFPVEVALDVGVGAIFTGMEPPDESAFDLAAAELPPERSLLARLPPPFNQGKRNTCVAFSIAAMLQQVAGDDVALSPQFIYWAAKARDGIPGDVGTRPDVAMQALAELGICAEPAWAYNPLPDHTNPGQGPPPAAALADALRRRATGYLNLPPTDVRGIKAVIAAGTSVLLGLEVREHWTTAWQARAAGRVRKALPGEAIIGGHAMLAVGYRDDAAAPGGGYFIVRNSWGTGWGAENPDGAGYAHIPYQLVRDGNMAAFAITGIAPPAAKVTPAAQPAAAPNQVAVAGMSLGSAGDTGALFAQALELSAALARDVAALNTLLRQLGDRLGQPSATSASAQLAPMAVPPARAALTGPLILLHAATPPADTPFVANGILATTGEPLLQIDEEGASELARAGAPPKKEDDPEYNLHESRVFHDENDHFGTALGNENDLPSSGWAVVVNADDDAALLRELTPLIVKRCADQGLPTPELTFRAGETCGVWLARSVANVNQPMKSKIPVLLYKPGESAAEFLARHGTSLAPVEPERGVPFYLMLVGRPGPLASDDTAFIPFAIQYELDIFWGVGRLCFSDPLTGQHRLASYRDYAEQVVAAEGAAAPPYGKHIAYFGTRHDDDRATQRSASELITPLFSGLEGQPTLATKLGFTQQLFLGQQATRATLDGILRGSAEGGRPAMLFTATHGMGFPADDPQLLAGQGALICQDWTGYGSIKREHWFAADDLSTQTRVDGLIAVCFACYGLGCPVEDQFVFEPGRERPRIAPYPLVAQLPQQLLARGALAVLGHVDRAWSHSFSAQGVPAQTQSFASVVGRLMKGDRLGFATDQFNMVQGAVASRLAELLEKIRFGYQATSRELSALWVARNDARNYAVLGDPAVRLPFS